MQLEVNSHSSQVNVVPVASRQELEDFIRVPWKIYANDAKWIPPLLYEQRRRVDPKHNPTLRAMKNRLWIARRGTETVGRISAQINDSYLRLHNEDTGHFGWIEAIDSEEVFSALTVAAEQWLRDQGMKNALGPFNFSVNEECGLLVKGFDTPPVFMMPHGRPYYAKQLERLGYEKAMDLLGYQFDIREPLPRHLSRLLERIKGDKAISLRHMSADDFEGEIRTVLEIFNDGWSGNWGFVPFSEDEIAQAAKDLKPLLPPESLCVAEYEGEAIGFALGLKNLNEMIADLDGRLFPAGWAKLLYRLKFGQLRTARLPLIGVKKAYHDTQVGAAVGLAVILELHGVSRAQNIQEVDLSWILESNRVIRSSIEALGVPQYKTYRIYAKQL